MKTKHTTTTTTTMNNTTKGKVNTMTTTTTTTAATIGETINHIAEVVAYKALKTAYSNIKTTTAEPLYRPKWRGDMHNEFTAIAALAMWDACQDADVYAAAENDADVWQAVTRPAYHAINKYISDARRESMKSLYSIDDVDADGNDIISNVTVSVRRATFETAATLRHNLTASEWQVLKYITLGYTTETIMRRMGYKTKASTLQKIKTTRAAAAEILRREYGIEKAISDRTKTRRRADMRK